SVHVDGFAQGPEENWGLFGRMSGLFIFIISILTDNCPSLGKGVPLMHLCKKRQLHKPSFWNIM
ncbi:MAG: hypothetical protein P8M01_02315, partial [Amylibacter sp.]|nr:hypothetical protein [Amylibacter sp.]